MIIKKSKKKIRKLKKIQTVITVHSFCKLPIWFQLSNLLQGRKCFSMLSTKITEEIVVTLFVTWNFNFNNLIPYWRKYVFCIINRIKKQWRLHFLEWIVLTSLCFPFRFFFIHIWWRLIFNPICSWQYFKIKPTLLESFK